MPNRTYSLNDLSVVTRAALFGPRNVRINVLNAIRDSNSQAAVSYAANLTTFGQGAVDTAMTAFKGNITNAAGGNVTADSANMEVLFTHAVLSHRGYRLQLLNEIRVGQSLGAVSYLVNTEQPTQGQIDTALANIHAIV